jgi:hypothetical protein
MKRFILLLFCVLSYNVSFALQDEKLDDYSFDESELQHETPPYFAIAGGPTFTFQFANFDAVNKHLLDKAFGVGEFSGQVSMWGGEGFTGVVYVPNLRVGFYSYGGSKTLSKEFPAVGEQMGSTREVEYKLGMTGISLEYAYVPLKSFAVVGGVSVGRGDLSISAYETPSESDWGNYKPNSNANNYLNIASTNYWLVKPNLHLEYAVTNFLMFRGSVSYNMSFGSDWKQNYISTLKGVPDDLNAKALQVQVGIFVGLFNY